MFLHHLLFSFIFLISFICEVLSFILEEMELSNFGLFFRQVLFYELTFNANIIGE